MGDCKIKINIKEGTFEIEGSEEFVEKYWTKIQDSVQNLPIMYSPPPEPSTKTTLEKPKKRNTKQRKQPSVELIPLDFAKGEGKPSLKEFLDEKSPKSNQEMITVFCFYLNEYLEIKNMKYGHALSCYDNVKIPKPRNIIQLFSDTRYHHKWIEVGDETHTVKLSISGENLVKHELSKHQKQKGTL